MKSMAGKHANLPEERTYECLSLKQCLAFKKEGIALKVWLVHMKNVQFIIESK